MTAFRTPCEQRTTEPLLERARGQINRVNVWRCGGSCGRFNVPRADDSGGGFQDEREQCGTPAGSAIDNGDVGLFGDRDRGRRLLTRLTAIACARHLATSAMSGLATGHLLPTNTAAAGAYRHVAGEQSRSNENRHEKARADHDPIFSPRRPSVNAP